MIGVRPHQQLTRNGFSDFRTSSHGRRSSLTDAFFFLFYLIYTAMVLPLEFLPGLVFGDPPTVQFLHNFLPYSPSFSLSLCLFRFSFSYVFLSFPSSLINQKILPGNNSLLIQSTGVPKYFAFVVAQDEIYEST